jgi:hypothetical protein
VDCAQEFSGKSYKDKNQVLEITYGTAYGNLNSPI